jgi:alginate O-acetyltransferase complex protein AlgI
VELRRNFEQPFLSRDIRELWQRWHTSLGSWFVEFVGTPLGGARRGAIRAAFNVLVIFTLIGLWHGAAWHFVFWGFINGVLVVLWRRVPVPKSRHQMKLRLAEIPGIAFTFALFCAGVVFFRSQSFHDGLVILKHIATLRGGVGGPATGVLVPIMLAAVLALDLMERRRRIATIETLRVRANVGGVATTAEAALESPVWELNAVSAGLLIGVLLLLLLAFSGGAPTPFIYFQF